MGGRGGDSNGKVDIPAPVQQSRSLFKPNIRFDTQRIKESKGKK